MPQAGISLTLSRHFSLSFIASGKSSGLHPVSSHSCWMYVQAGRPAFARPSIHRGKMELILLAYGLPKETVAAITILYRNTKVKVRSPDGDTEYFDIIAGVLQWDTLAHNSLSSVKTTCLEDRLIKSERTASSWQRKGAERAPQKQLLTPTTQMTVILANISNIVIPKYRDTI